MIDGAVFTIAEDQGYRFVTVPELLEIRTKSEVAPASPKI